MNYQCWQKIIGLTETKLENSVLDEEIEIAGYTSERSDGNKRGGGVTCFIKEQSFMQYQSKFL